MQELPGKGLSPGRLALAMKLNILTGCLATVWGIVCQPNPIFNVFVRNGLGASASTLGLLVGLLQLSGVFQIVAIFVYGLAPRKKPFFVAAHLAHRLLTVAIAAAAFVAAARGDRSWGIKAIMIALPLSWSFMNASSAGWWSWVADIFPEKMRGAFFLKRSAILNVINIVWFFLASMSLDLFDGQATFWVYGAIFTVGVTLGIVDIVLNIFIPEPVPAERPVFKAADALEPLKNGNFIRFSVAAGFTLFSINLALAFQSPFIVDPARVGAPNTWLGIMYVISQAAWVLTAPFWGTVMDKWGRKPVVTIGCLFVLAWTGYFFLTPRTYTFLLPLISIGVGLLSPAYYEGVNQMMLSLTPDKNRISFVAWYLAISGIVSAGGSVVGGLIFDSLKGFEFVAGPFRFVDFHAVQLLAILMVLLSAFIISRVKEGKERPIAFVVGRVANPGIIRTFAYLDDLSGADDPLRAQTALRSMEAETGDLALDEIIARLDDPYIEVREEAARALGRIAAPAAVEPLIERVVDPRSSIRIPAARALGKIGDERASIPLAETLASAGSEDLAEACLQALGDIGGDRAAEAVRAFYPGAPTERLRASASEAAGRLDVFEAARDILPRLVEAKTAMLRRQYAIALGNLLGDNVEFYRYVSGSDALLAERVRKLFSRLEANLRSASRRLSGPGGEKPTRAELSRLSGLSRQILAKLESGADEEALSLMVSVSVSLMANIFGHREGDPHFIELAFRVDPKLGAYEWLVAEARALLDADARGEGFGRSENPGEVRRLIVLLIAFALAGF